MTRYAAGTWSHSPAAVPPLLYSLKPFMRPSCGDLCDFFATGIT